MMSDDRVMIIRLEQLIHLMIMIIIMNFMYMAPFTTKREDVSMNTTTETLVCFLLNELNSHHK